MTSCFAKSYKEKTRMAITDSRQPHASPRRERASYCVLAKDRLRHIRKTIAREGVGAACTATYGHGSNVGVRGALSDIRNGGERRWCIRNHRDSMLGLRSIQPINKIRRLITMLRTRLHR